MYVIGVKIVFPPPIIYLATPNTKAAFFLGFFWCFHIDLALPL